MRGVERSTQISRDRQLASSDPGGRDFQPKRTAHYDFIV
jgi:hypothetical protein